MKHLYYLNKYIYRYKYHFLGGLFFVLISNFFSLYPPKILGYAVDMVQDNIILSKNLGSYSNKDFFNFFKSLLLVASLAIIITSLVRGVFMFFMRQTLIVMSRKIEYDLKNDVYAHYQKLSTSFYKRNNTGDLMSRITEDVSRVRMYLGPAIMYFINLVTLFAMIIFTMFKINAYLSFIVLLPLPILSYSIYKVSTLINLKSEKIQSKLSDLTSFCQETFSGIRVIKSFVRERDNEVLFDKNCDDYKSKSLELAKVEALFSPMMLLLIGLSTVLTIYIGGMEVMRGRFTTGNIAEFVFYINMLTWPVASLGWLVSLVQRASASQKRINEFLDTQPDIINQNLVKLEAIDTIEFDNVSFDYPDTGIKALKNINLKINKGNKIAIVGRTGSGKSTFAELLLRCYDTTTGVIKINGEDIKSIDLHRFRELTGYVPQDVFLFSETITNNILFGLRPSQEADPKEAARKAVIDKDISKLRYGYDTMVGERGVMLSGGQKQRISLARALIKDPDLLILDDCLSAVDVRTENKILNNFKKEFLERTVVFITHRLFSQMDYDMIYVLDNGAIVENGKHDELLSKMGVYFDMYQKQQKEEG
jgi:ATP-binding cassette, subfamily B, multidrug efflux pump